MSYVPRGCYGGFALFMSLRSQPTRDPSNIRLHMREEHRHNKPYMEFILRFTSWPNYELIPQRHRFTKWWDFGGEL